MTPSVRNSPNRKLQRDRRVPRSPGRVQKPRDHTEPENSPPKDETPNRFPIIGIGASAGGLEAFTELLKHLPLDSGMGFVLVQHLDPQHESALTQLLKRATSMPVREITNNLRVEANHIYVFLPNTNLGIGQGVLKLKRRPQNRGVDGAVPVMVDITDLKESSRP